MFIQYAWMLCALIVCTVDCVPVVLAADSFAKKRPTLHSRVEINSPGSLIYEKQPAMETTTTTNTVTITVTETVTVTLTGTATQQSVIAPDWEQANQGAQQQASSGASLPADQIDPTTPVQCVALVNNQCEVGLAATVMSDGTTACCPAAAAAQAAAAAAQAVASTQTSCVQLVNGACDVGYTATQMTDGTTACCAVVAANSAQSVNSNQVVNQNPSTVQNTDQNTVNQNTDQTVNQNTDGTISNDGTIGNDGIAITPGSGPLQKLLTPAPSPSPQPQEQEQAPVANDIPVEHVVGVLGGALFVIMLPAAYVMLQGKNKAGGKASSKSDGLGDESASPEAPLKDK
jgi:hypothetical protein